MEITTMTRRIIKIDGGNDTHIDTDSTIRKALDTAGITNLPPSIVSGGEIIRASDFNHPVPSHDMLLNQTPIVKGASLRERLLDQELELIATRFLGEFPGRERSLELDENSLLIGAFPLPDDYSPDYIDLLFLISRYPEVPPAGIHIPSESPLRQQIAKHLDGHVYGRSLIPESDFRYIEKFSKYGRIWTCLHYEKHAWKLNPNNLLAGDCLYKFIENTFAALSGGHRD
jgi:hypothetical protein